MKFRKMMGCIALGLTCAMIGAGATMAAQNTSAAAEAVTAANSTTTVVTSPFTAAVQQVRNSVVGVSNYQTVRYGSYGNNFYFGYGFGYGNGRNNDQQIEEREELAATGSGVVIGQGFVLTNYHVVEDASSLRVTVTDDSGNTDEYAATLVAYDESLDIAIVYATGLDLPAVTLGDSDTLQVGDWAINIGNPLGFTKTTTVGVVSALNRAIESESYDKYGRKSTITNAMIQVDAAINSGNSGGPLFDMNGNVIGITSAKYSGSTSSGASIEGISFAIPINDALRVIYDLQQYGHVTGRAYLGVTVKDLDSTTAATYGLPTGPMIRTVEEGGCAEKAGLQEGDIIIGFNDAEISSYTDLVAALNKCRAGDTATIKVYRAGAEVEASVTLDERPTDDVITERENAAQNEQSQQDNQQSGQQGQPGSGSDSSNGYSYGYGNMNPFEFFQQIPGFGN